MSMDESGEGAERRFSWPMSRTNTVLVAVCMAGALVCLVLGATIPGIALLLGGIGGGAGAVLARRGSSGDLERVNALEYADERDRTAAMKGLAAVGVTALILSTLQLMLFALVGVDPVARFAAIGMFLVLVACWFVANWFFVRRG
jgi:hypothetical protein